MKKILIVEDEESVINILSDKFSQEGFEILKARNGEEGLELALEKHPDLILLDIIMPKMDGITMLNKLREDEWGKEVPVVVLTNLSAADKKTKRVEKEVNEYLIKADWKLDDVVKKVEQELNNK